MDTLQLYTVHREGRTIQAAREQWRGEDLVWCDDGQWHRASEMLQSRASGWGAAILAALGTVAAGVVAYKLVQTATDEDLGDGEYPLWFRVEMIDAHVERHGRVCLHCGCRVRRSDSAVDHIVALSRGGKTSRANAQVMCKWCNSSKGARTSMLDRLRGAAA